MEHISVSFATICSTQLDQMDSCFSSSVFIVDSMKLTLNTRRKRTASSTQKIWPNVLLLLLSSEERNAWYFCNIRPYIANCLNFLSWVRSQASDLLFDAWQRWEKNGDKIDVQKCDWYNNQMWTCMVTGWELCDHKFDSQGERVGSRIRSVWVQRFW